jgi:hypothetical protein
MSRELLDQEVARSFREAQLNRKRWARMAEALELCDDIPAPVAQLCLACRAASELSTGASPAAYSTHSIDSRPTSFQGRATT